MGTGDPHIPNARTAPREITTIGEKYRVEKMLGSGGMGTVYACTNTWTGRRVAIKLLRPELSAVPAVVKRFAREAQASTRIRHPHIVDVLDMGRDSETGALFIVQAFLEGEDLGEWMRTHRRMSAREAFQLIIPVMEAIAAANEAGIVHRDIKPDNIFLARNEHGVIVPIVIDFGISLITTSGAPDRMTLHGVAIGTPEYMSPEQAAGEADLDARTDVWSLGIVLYELLSGVVPFVAPNYNLTILRVLTETVARIEEVVPGLPSSVAAIVHRALERDRAVRYASVRDMLVAVRACAERDLDRAGAPKPRVLVKLPGVVEATRSAVDRSASAESDRATADDLPAAAVIDSTTTDPGHPARPRPVAFALALLLVVAVVASRGLVGAVPPMTPGVGAKAARQLAASIRRAQPELVARVDRETPLAVPTNGTRVSTRRAPSVSPANTVARASHPTASLLRRTTISSMRNVGALDVVRRHHIVVE